MCVLLGCRNQVKLEGLKRALEASGYEVLAVSSKQSWENLKSTGYPNRVQVVISEYRLGSFFGHDMVAEINFRMPALIWGARKSWLDSIRKAVCFPNLTFTEETMSPEKISQCVTQLKSAQALEKV